MRNVGTQINELMKVQGFDHTAYGRASSWNTKSGLELHLWTCTPDRKKVAVNRNADNTYHIDTNPTHNNYAPCIVKDNIAEDVLFETFAAEMVILAP
jgi:hypothetical protein